MTWKTPIETVLGEEFHSFIQRVPVLRLLFPFVKTPTKIIEYWAKMSGFTKKSWELMLHGTPEQKVQQWAGFTVSSLTYAFGAQLFINGLLTPSPRNEAERRAMQEAGLQPNAIKIGDHWVNLNTIDPWPALYFSTAANIYRAWLEAETADEQEKLLEITSGFLWATKEAVLSKTWFISLRDTLDAMEGVGTENFVRRMVETTKPFYGIRNFHKQTFAKYLEETNLKLSQSAPKLDSFGKPIETYKIIFGLRTSETAESPIRREIINLGITLPHINQTLKGIKLPDEQYYELYKVLDTKFHVEEELNKLIQSKGYQQASLAQKREVILKTYAQYVEQAKAYIFNKYPELQEAYKEKLIEGEPEPKRPNYFNSEWEKFLKEIP